MKKRIIIVVVLVAAIAAVIWAVSLRNRPSDDRIRFSGNIEVDEVQAAFQIPGRLVERAVSEGDRVRKGEVIGRLEDAELTHEVATRRADLDAAQSKLGELEAGFRPEEIADARAALRGAQAELDHQSSELARAKKLYRDDVISQRELEAVEAAYRVASSRADQAKEKLRLVESGVRREQIAQARAGVEQSAQILASAQTRYGYATLTSPIDGVVLSENAQPGEMLAAGAPVVTLGDLGSIYVNGYIPETRLGRIRLGEPVVVTTDTYPGKKYRGQVSFISSEAEFTPKQVQTPEERVKLVYRIKVRVENPNFELKPGMPVDAEIPKAKASGSNGVATTGRERSAKPRGATVSVARRAERGLLTSSGIATETVAPHGMES